MKKLFALLLACMMLLTAGVAMAEDTGTTTSTSAYAAVSPHTNPPTITHTMSLSNGETELSYSIGYSFTVSDVEIVKPTGIVNKSLAVEGSPTIADLVYNSSHDFSTGSFSQNLNIDWTGVTIKEPGVYRWTVTKGLNETLTTVPEGEDGPSDELKTTYLYVYAIDDGGTLTIRTAFLSAENKSDSTETKTGLSDQYPVQTLDLTVNKQVTGNQGSKDQYFEFRIALTLPVGAAQTTFDITGDFDAIVPATAYHVQTENTNTLTATGGTQVEKTLWLKHGQSFTIENLLYGTSYSVIENAPGYTVTTKSISKTTETNGTGNTITESTLVNPTTITFTNFKETPVPTGIDLQTGAPIMGLLLAASMLLMLFISKRREAAE